MTTMRKTLIAAALFLATGARVYEGHRSSALQSEARALQQQQAQVKKQIQHLRQELDEATHRLASLVEANHRWEANSNELARLRGEVVLLRRDSEQLKAFRGLQSADPHVAEMVGWLNRVQRLKDRLAQHPEASIPELGSLKEGDWLGIAAGQPKLDSEADYRDALNRLRGIAEARNIYPMRDAIVDYTKANNGMWPTDLTQIKPFLKAPIDDAILQRYEIVAADTLPMTTPMSGWVLTQRASVDPDFEWRLMVGSDDFSVLDFKHSEMFRPLLPAIRAYLAANNGQMPEDADLTKLAPYVRTAEEQAALASATQQYESASPEGRTVSLNTLKSLRFN
jgi:hypothetical protein